ncbi:Xaa-Pro dipeptidyl-peptidase [Plantactinospora sp. S1510]|uniref:Xaa-Pro dipeptidyl-peptidase n=1 Tax=Plantactinospora alkalitolerans TaxID=2789879 RepID=A0ABS0GS91_9ACTN|nr:CocE/NonD family hydrolase [Plantactinospora alkalitolerans]MBF9128757.1 Xaa-Pro dipeptidyl-peptidase [Plantactinospora alkalitolerans]
MSRSFAGTLLAGATAVGSVLVVPAGAIAAPVEPPGLVIEGGATQPVFARDAAIQETVYVNSEMDSDGDGQPDRIAVQVIRPEETDAGLQVATVMHASPYFGDSTAPRGNLIVPAHFTTWYDDYFVPRGYAVVEVDMQGTAGSDGCATIGGPEDVRSASAAIDWLNGRATASYSDGTPAVADWSSGSVGMIGVSYAGTLPIAVAETGIEGLETIVPIAGISSWYDYARADGIAYGGFSGRYPESLARYVSSPAHDAECETRYTQLGDAADDATADLNAFWQQRDYRDGAAQVDASVFLVHGQQDNNTKTTHFGRYWDAITGQGVPRKLWLHDGGHTNPFGSDLVGRDTVGRWMDHWLYDIANGIMNEPQATIRRPDGTTDTYPVWPAAVTQTSFYLGGPDTGAAGTLLAAQGLAVDQSFTDNRGQLEYPMTTAPETAKPNRLVYLAPTLTTARRLSGTGTVEVRFSATSTSTPLTAMLVHYTNGVPTRVVSRGAIDTKNRTSLTTGTPLTPGTAYTVTVRLEPKDYVFPVGSRIGLVLVANHNEYLTTDPLAAGVTVQLSPSRLLLPLA